MIKQDNTAAYLTMLHDVYHQYEHISAPRGMEIREILNYQITIESPDAGAIKTNDHDRNKIIKSYTKREIDWYKSGDRAATSAPTKFWQTIADKDGNINSNYGDLALFDESEGLGMTPYEWAFVSLVQDKDSRQAILRYNKPKHAMPGTKDFVCTMYQNFHIRDNQLHSTVRMRSADLFTGPVYDIPWFSYVMLEMVRDLRKVYPGLNCGNLTFSADSLHIYQRDFDKIEKMIGDGSFPTLDGKGNWTYSKENT